MPLLLSRRFIDEITKRAIDYIKAFFGEESLRGITISLDFSTGIKIRFDRATGKVVIKVGRLVPLSRHDLEKLLIYKILKIASYRFVCPRDVYYATKIIKNAIEVADYALGVMISAFIVEIICDFELMHLAPDLAVDALKIQRKHTRSRGMLVDLWAHLVNLMFGDNVVVVSNPIVKKTAEEIYNLMFRRNIRDPNSWEIIVKDVSKCIKDMLGDEEIEKEIQMFKKSVGYDPRDLYVPILTLQSVGDWSIMDAFHAVYGISKHDSALSCGLLFGSIALQPKEVLRLWYRQRAHELIRVLIKEQVIMRSHKINYPVTWSLGDDVEELDVYLSSNLSPIIIPGYTTKKWKSGKSAPRRISRRAPDILIIIDSSGSMGKLHGYQYPQISTYMKKLMKNLGISYVIGSKFDIAVVTAFGILDYALMIGCDVGVVNFSSIAYSADFSQNRNKLEDVIMIHQNKGTKFPITTIKKMLAGRQNVLVIILSDAAIYNRRAASKFLEKVAKEHTVYFFHIELPARYEVLECVKRGGGFVINIRDLNELPKMAITIAEKHTKGIITID